MKDNRRIRRRPTFVRSLLSLAALMASTAQATQLDVDNPDLSIRFDNTFKGSVLYRLQSASPELVNSYRNIPGIGPFPQALNFTAGDDNFREAGVFSKRVDLLSELDVVYRKTTGLRLSAAGWYDAAYNGQSDATDVFNGQSPTNEFPSGTRSLAGRKAEVLDAFVFTDWDLGDGKKLTARLGRHSLLYGESIFFGDNGIARAQGPLDIFKLQSSPNAQFKEILRPVPQLSAELQLSTSMSIGAYYQFRWEADRLSPAGSYFSTANIPWGSQQSQFLNLGPAGSYLLTPGTNSEPGDSGQFGAQLKWHLADTDLGFYAARYHDKDGQAYGVLAPLGAPVAPGVSPGNWSYTFGQSVKVYGVSASRSIGDFNVAAEVSLRDGTPLLSTEMLYVAGSAAPQYATGRTAHINLSTLASFGPNFLAKESTFIGELAWNRLLSKNDPDGSLDAGRTRDATAIQFIYTPTYRQVMNGLDISVPFGLRYTLDGRSSVTYWDAQGSGSANIGIEGNYLNGWQFSLTYTNYIGSKVPFYDYSPALTGGPGIYSKGNPLADRNFIAFSLRRTF